MPTNQYIVDAFTDRPFAGNPAAVCLLDGPADETWMQALATENNLSETAFVEPADGAGLRPLRWFTPTVEVPLCGHATLATAHVLFTEVGVTDDVVRFATRSGPLTASRRPPAGVEIDLPAATVTAVAEGEATAVRAAVLGDAAGGPAGVVPVWRGSNSMVLVVLDSFDAVRGCRPDLPAVAALDAFGVVVSAAGDPAAPGPDVVSRFFGPAVGIDEDPVTGAAHCLVGPFWAERLGRAVLRAHQASARGGDLVLTVRGDRVGLAGAAVTVSSATLSAAAST